MKITLIPKVGGQPLTLDVSMFVVRQDNGTPIACGAEYGQSGQQAVSCAGNPDFQQILRVLGIHTTVVVDTLHLPKPDPGFRLVAGPEHTRGLTNGG